jgi:NADH-quinone oxidoreductase subunit E
MGIQLESVSAEPMVFPRLNRELWRYRGEPGQLIPLLQAAQDSYGYISETAIKYISGVTSETESEVYGVITFYKQFRLRPQGKYLIRLCDGTACHVNNARMRRMVIEDNLHLESGDTTEDGLFTLDPVACIGCCSLAPVIMVNDQTHGRLTPKKLRTILRNYRREGLVALQGGKE